MNKYTVLIRKKVVKQLNKMPKGVADKLKIKILALEDEPRPKYSKKLKGRDAYRIKSGIYRIIYEIEDNIFTVIIIAIGHRKDVYRK